LTAGSLWQRLSRSPLLHFLLAGAALATLQSWLWPEPPRRTEPVVVDEAVLANLTRSWSRATGRLPSDAEREVILQDWVDQELLVREAIARGLSQQDALVTRRLIQNQRFIEEGTADPPLTNAELLARARALGVERTDLVVRRRLIERMREIILSGSLDAKSASEPNPPPEGPPWIRITQLYVSSDRSDRSDWSDREPVAIATGLLEQLRSRGLRPGDPDVKHLGDAFLLPRDLPPMTEQRLAARFGTRFGEAVSELPLEQWSAPIESSYGLHLVWPHERGRQIEGDKHASDGQLRTEERQQASMQEALQILRQGVDVIRYDQPASP
jgi:peptidyl-prolyl cis-trans isomerase C